MVASAGIGPPTTVLEIGPGFGILTERLLATGAAVVAIELDKRLAGFLRHQFHDVPRLQLVEGDVWRVNLSQYLADREYVLVANLPYGMTSLVFRNFLTLPPRPKSMTLMIQDEVARRVTAAPGEMSLLGVIAQYYARPKYLFPVDRESFVPPPTVTSAVIHCEVLPAPDPDSERRFLRAVKAGFSSRRKQLHNALAAGLHISPKKTEKILITAGLRPDQRAQELRINDWRKIAEELV